LDILSMIGFFALWLFLQAYLFPKLGVPT